MTCGEVDRRTDQYMKHPPHTTDEKYEKKSMTFFDIIMTFFDFSMTLL